MGVRRLHRLVMMIVGVIIGCFPASLRLAAQPIDTEAESRSHHVAAEAQFNGNDIFAGATFYYTDPFGEDFALVGGFNLRPYGKRTLIPESPGVYLYMREERYSALLGIDRQLPLTDRAGVFAGLQAWLSYSRYRGTDRTSWDLIAPVANAGFQLSLPRGRSFAGDIVSFRLGAEFVNLQPDRWRLFTSILVGI